MLERNGEQTMNEESQEIEIDLKELFFVVRKKILLILIVMVVAGAGTGIICKYFMTPMYQSTSKLYILSQSTSITSIADIQVGSFLTQDYMELIYSRPVLEEVIEKQKLSETYEELKGKISLSNPSDTRIIEITVTYDEPNTAKAIVDELAEIAKKSISQIMATDEPNIVESGVVNPDKVSPTTVKNALIASLLAALLAIGIIAVRHILNDSIRSSDDVEKYLGLNVLASIPIAKSEESDHKRKRWRKSGIRTKRGGSR